MSGSEIIKESPIFHVEITKAADHFKVAFMGKLDEQVDFTRTWDKILKYGAETPRISFDLSQVTAINSIGIRTWILFINKIEDFFVYEFSLVGEVFAESGGCIQNMFGRSGVAVHAFMSPYFCEPCQLHFNKPLTLQLLKVNGDRYRAPDLPCDQCKKPMKFDGIEEEYFNFLNYVNMKRK